MIGEDFFRDFFNLPSKRWADPAYIASRETVNEALELAKGQPPEANLMPYIELIHAAKKLGLKVVRS